MTYIIGVGHRSGHGKDTFANFFVEHFNNLFKDTLHGLKIRKLSWAWKLKDACFQLYKHLGLREPEFYETDEGRKLRNIKLPCIGLTPVEIWIKFGSYGVRDHVWDLTWVEWVKHNNTDVDVIINGDTRFPVEIPYCDFTIKIVNPKIPNREGVSVDDKLAHYLSWNLIVMNDGTKEDLSDKAKQVCHQLFSGNKINETSDPRPVSSQ